MGWYDRAESDKGIPKREKEEVLVPGKCSSTSYLEKLRVCWSEMILDDLGWSWMILDDLGWSGLFRLSGTIWWTEVREQLLQKLAASEQRRRGKTMWNGTSTSLDFPFKPSSTQGYGGNTILIGEIFHITKWSDSVILVNIFGHMNKEL